MYVDVHPLNMLVGKLVINVLPWRSIWVERPSNCTYVQERQATNTTKRINMGYVSTSLIGIFNFFQGGGGWITFNLLSMDQQQCKLAVYNIYVFKYTHASFRDVHWQRTGAAMSGWFSLTSLEILFEQSTANSGPTDWTYRNHKVRYHIVKTRCSTLRSFLLEYCEH